MPSNETLYDMQQIALAEQHAHAIIIRVLLACLLAEKTDAEVELITSLIPAYGAKLDDLPTNATDEGAEFMSNVIVRAQEKLEKHVQGAKKWSPQFRIALSKLREIEEQAHKSIGE